MIRVLAFVIAAFSPIFAAAQEVADDIFADLLVPMQEAELDKYLWKNRLLLVFSDNALEPRFVEQVKLLREGPRDLAERDVRIVLDAEPDKLSPLREEFRPRGFMLMLIGKDGQVYLRKPLPWDIREITRSIDKLPLRQQEVRDRRS